MSKIVDLLEGAGGAIVVLVGIVAVVVIAGLALDGSSDKGVIASGTSAAIGTIVGAFFGIKAGSGGRKEAETARDSAEAARAFEASKVEYLAGHLTGGDEQIDSMLEGARKHASAETEARRSRP